VCGAWTSVGGSSFFFVSSLGKSCGGEGKNPSKSKTKYRSPIRIRSEHPASSLEFAANKKNLKMDRQPLVGHFGISPRGIQRFETTKGSFGRRMSYIV